MGREQVLFEFKGPWGVPVQIGSSIIFLAMLFVGLSFSPMSLALFAILMLSIFLHEMGHAWGALIQGIPVTRVMLYGGGGFCQHGRSATAYQSELIVVMGPLTNLALWAISGLLGQLLIDSVPPIALTLLSMFSRVNLFLALFNLIPVFPLDGGRLLHLVLLRLVAPRRASRISGGIGLVLSVLWIPAMIFLWISGGWLLIFFPSIRLHLDLARGRIIA